MIDLHLHSTASDGTTPPDQLMLDAAAAGLTVVALTDHDTTAGWADAARALPTGLTLVPGAELSCRWQGSERPIGLHLLAYLFDPEHAPLVQVLHEVRRSRLSRAEGMVDLLTADGVPITWDEVLASAQGGTVGRPHIASALVRAGLVADTQEAFGPQWLGARYKLPKLEIDVFEALRLVKDAGGVCVFAHPMATVRGRVVPESVIADLATAGLDGVEADHHDHTPAQRERIRGLAEELDLIVTGSSDFHGRHKKVRLGEHTTSPESLQRLLGRASGIKPISMVSR